MFTELERRRLLAGQPVDVGNKRYALCRGCRRAIRVNGFFGGIHVCAEQPKAEEPPKQPIEPPPSEPYVHWAQRGLK